MVIQEFRKKGLGKRDVNVGLYLESYRVGDDWW